MPELSNRTATFTDSVIRRMTRISNKYGAVNLSQGFPDFEPPREILDRLAELTLPIEMDITPIVSCFCVSFDFSAPSFKTNSASL